MLGSVGGIFLGLINGVLVLFAGSTEIFLANAPGGTVAVCLIKGLACGLISGLLYKVIAKKNKTVASIIASLIVPIINTGLFVAGCFTLIGPAVEALNTEGTKTVTFIFLALVGWNFIFEFGVTSIISPTITKIIKIVTRSDKHAL